MNRYYFDSECDGSANVDEEGCEFQSLQQVRAEALRGLASIVADEVANAKRSILVSVTVKDETGNIVLRTHFEGAMDVRNGVEAPHDLIRIQRG